MREPCLDDYFIDTPECKENWKEKRYRQQSRGNWILDPAISQRVLPKKPTISQSGQIYSKTNINYDLKIACNKISVDYQIICLDSQGYFFISNPDTMILLIKRFIRESNCRSIRRDVSRPNSSPNIFNFLFTTLFILPLNICLHTSQCFCLVEPSDKTLKK